MQFHPNDLSDLDDLTEEHLGFSALSEGLGFAKAPKPAVAPSSATKSGTNPAMPTGERTRYSVPTSDDRELEPEYPVRMGIGAEAAGPARPAPAILSTTKPKLSPAAQVLAEPAAPQTVRMAAFVIDCLAILLPFSAAWAFSFGGQAWEIFRADVRPPLSLLALMLATYFLLSESFGGQSLGKMALGLRVVEDDKYQKPTGFAHALKRICLLLLGTALGGLGLWASFRDGKRRPWHDRYSGSIVRRCA